MRKPLWSKSKNTRAHRRPSVFLIRRSLKIPGIGAWTAQYVAMRALGEPNAFPSSDLGLLRALSLDSAREVERRAEPWQPWRAYAAMYLWRMGGRKSHGKSQRKNVERALLEGSEGQRVAL